MSQSELLTNLHSQHARLWNELHGEREQIAQDRAALDRHFGALQEQIEVLSRHHLGLYDASIARLDSAIAQLGTPLGPPALAAPEAKAATVLDMRRRIADIGRKAIEAPSRNSGGEP